MSFIWQAVQRITKTSTLAPRRNNVIGNKSMLNPVEMQFPLALFFPPLQNIKMKSTGLVWLRNCLEADSFLPVFIQTSYLQFSVLFSLVIEFKWIVIVIPLVAGFTVILLYWLSCFNVLLVYLFIPNSILVTLCCIFCNLFIKYRMMAQ